MGSMFFLLALFFGIENSPAQSRTSITGKVIDKTTGEVVPFVNVFFKGTQTGTTTDFEGRYRLATDQPTDSLVFSYIGYKVKTVPVAKGISQQINTDLESDVFNLQEVVVYSGENPAWAIIRNAVDQKKKFNKTSLEAFEYESYTKIEIDVDNISEEMKKEKVFRDISKVMDSIAVLKGDDGDTYVPIFFSEAISRYYVKHNPVSRREEVLKTKISGIAIQDGSLTSQVVGAFYQEYNFYNNWLNILQKDFVSPIADGWRLYYDYEIMDRVVIRGDTCYQLRVIPNRPEDLAFTGTIWISQSDYALRQVDLTIVKEANLNFIDKIKIQQELSATNEGPLLPSKTRVMIDVQQPSKRGFGFLAKFYNSNNDWKINQPRGLSFYENNVIVAEDMYIYDADYWAKHRHDSLTREEVLVYEIIDTLKTVPIVKTYTKLITTLSTGYLTGNKFDFGPYLYTYAHNEVEGHRFVLGGRSSEYLSKKMYLKGYLAYGTRDSKFKYAANLGFIFSRRPWIEGGFRSKYDIEQVGLNSERLENNFIFYASTKYGELVEPFFQRQQKLYFQTGVTKGLSQRLELKYDQFDPLFDFYYYTQPGEAGSGLRSSYTSAALRLHTHWGRDEMFVQNGNERISMGARRAPIFDFMYTYGLKGVANSDFEYHKMEMQMSHRLRMGLAGATNYRLNGGYIIGQLPYPLLENHVGNESFFYTTAAFNTMNLSEFVSDHYVSLRLYHSFQGFILNRIPLMKKLQWRLLATSNIIYGGLRDENREMIPEISVNGSPVKVFNSLSDLPFVEVGYGVENIFKVVRVDFIHRLTYRGLPDVDPFRIKISAQFIL